MSLNDFTDLVDQLPQSAIYDHEMHGNLFVYISDAQLKCAQEWCLESLIMRELSLKQMLNFP